MSTTAKAAVFERGLGLIKAGLAEQTDPGSVFNTSGTVSNLDDMVKDCKRALCDELKVKPADYPVLVTVPPLTTVHCKEMMTQKLFDALEVPAVQFANQSTLAAYATGRKTAMVVDCGPEVTWLVAVMDGYSVQDATMKLEVGGTTITKAGCGIDALFNPSTVGCCVEGIHKLIYQSINKCETGTQAELWKNLVLSGDTTMLPGFQERLTKELTSLAPGGITVNIIAPPTRANSIFIGGAILAGIEAFQTMWITRKEYLDQGASAVQMKNLDTYRP